MISIHRYIGTSIHGQTFIDLFLQTSALDMSIRATHTTTTTTTNMKYNDIQKQKHAARKIVFDLHRAQSGDLSDVICRVCGSRLDLNDLMELPVVDKNTTAEEQAASTICQSCVHKREVKDAKKKDGVFYKLILRVLRVFGPR